MATGAGEAGEEETLRLMFFVPGFYNFMRV